MQYKCEFCEKSFDKKKALAGHMKAHPKSEREEIKRKRQGIRKIDIRVVGIGGGGNSIIKEIASQMQGLKFVAANTDLEALKDLDQEQRIQSFEFGKDLTQGMGTGMDFELGQKAAYKDQKRIKKLLEGKDFCIFVSCLGGGTGSGATPVFAKTSKDLGNLNFGIFTLPFEFEGEKKAHIARQSLTQLRPYLDGFCIIPNQRIFQIVDKKTPLKKALSAINQRMARSLEGLITIIKKPSLINIDFADLNTILDHQNKLAFLNKIEFERGEQDRLGQSILSPLYPYGIDDAGGLLFHLVGGEKLGIGEINEICRKLHQSVNNQAKIIFGINQKDNLKDQVTLTLLATGCKGPEYGAEPSSKQNSSEKKENPTPENDSNPESESEQNSRKRRNALEIQKKLEQQEKQRKEKEKTWEVPAILRKKEAKRS